MIGWAVECAKRLHFWTSPLLYADEKGSDDEQHECSFFESSDGGVTKVVDKRPQYVGVTSLSVFRGNIG